MAKNQGPSLLAKASTPPCGFCQGASVMATDTPKDRTYKCQTCGSVETIITGKGPWWYCGWKHPDGRALRSPTSEEMQRGNYGWQEA